MSNRVLSILIGGALLLLFFRLALLEYGHTFPHSHPWKVGDWLISYDFGFVRRGLTGSVLLLLWRSLGIPPLSLLFTLQEFCYSVLFLEGYLLLKQARFDFLKIAVLFSPAFLLFPLLDFEGGYRKEILHFAILALFIRSTTPRGRGLWAFLWLISIFTHEMLLMALPYYVYGLWSVGVRKRWLAGFSFVAFEIVAILSQFKGDLDLAIKTCRLWTDLGLEVNVCKGAIGALSTTFDLGFKTVAQRVAAMNYLEVYGAGLVLTLVPFAIYGRAWRKHRALLWSCLASIALTVPVAFLAFDWGRWIHIQAVSLGLFFLAEADNLYVVPRWTKRSCLVGLGLFIWLVTWGLPHCCQATLRDGLWTLLYPL